MILNTIPSLETIPSLAFNLGGHYNEKGQQCAAAQVAPGLVCFVDIARGLDYWYECELNVRVIRDCYLYNRNIFVQTGDYSGLYKLRSDLEQLAKTAPSI